MAPYLHEYNKERGYILFPICNISRAVERLSLSQYEVYCFQAKHYTVEAKEGTVDFFQNAVERGLALRVIRGHKAGFSYTTDFHEPAIQQMVKSAWKSG